MRTVLILLLLILWGPMVAHAQGPTLTPTPPPTSTPSFTIGLTRIILPTQAEIRPAGNLIKTAIPLTITPNALSGLQIDVVDLMGEAIIAQKNITNIMGDGGKIIHILVSLTLAVGAALALVKVFKRSQSLMMTVRSDISFRMEHGIGMGMGLKGTAGEMNRGFDRRVREMIERYNNDN